MFKTFFFLSLIVVAPGMLAQDKWQGLGFNRLLNLWHPVAMGQPSVVKPKDCEDLMSRTVQVHTFCTSNVPLLLTFGLTVALATMELQAWWPSTRLSMCPLPYAFCFEHDPLHIPVIVISEDKHQSCGLGFPFLPSSVRPHALCVYSSLTGCRFQTP